MASTLCESEGWNGSYVLSDMFTKYSLNVCMSPYHAKSVIRKDHPDVDADRTVSDIRAIVQASLNRAPITRFVTLGAAGERLSSALVDDSPVFRLLQVKLMNRFGPRIGQPGRAAWNKAVFPHLMESIIAEAEAKSSTVEDLIDAHGLSTFSLCRNDGTAQSSSKTVFDKYDPQWYAMRGACTGVAALEWLMVKDLFPEANPVICFTSEHAWVQDAVTGVVYSVVDDLPAGLFKSDKYEITCPNISVYCRFFGYVLFREFGAEFDEEILKDYF